MTGQVRAIGRGALLAAVALLALAIGTAAAKRLPSCASPRRAHTMLSSPVLRVYGIRPSFRTASGGDATVSAVDFRSGAPLGLTW